MAAKMAAIFIENARTPLKAAKTCLFFWFWALIVNFERK